jgi:type II secretory pathway pseudopilin PulG
LASVVLVALNGARQKSRDAKRVADLNQLAKAMELYFNDVFAYPTGVGAAGAGTNYVPTTVGSGGNIFGSAILSSFNAINASIAMTPTYITSIPTSPIPPDGSCNSTTNSYRYETNARGSTYTFTFCLGAVTGSIAPAGVHYLTPGGFK